MSEFLLVKRELLEYSAALLEHKCPGNVANELRAVLAQEAGKCEPAYQLPEHARGDKWYGFGYCDFSSGEDKSRLIDYLKDLLDAVPEEPLYTSPPAPVSVNERVEFEMEFDSCNLDRNEKEEYENPFVQSSWEGWQARACLEKVKELNQ